MNFLWLALAWMEIAARLFEVAQKNAEQFDRLLVVVNRQKELIDELLEERSKITQCNQSQPTETDMATNRKKPSDLIEQFAAEYAQALSAAERAAETTATDGWQSLYSEFMARNAEQRRIVAKSIAFLADSVSEKPLCEEDIKELKDDVKDAIELSEASMLFDAMVIGPMRSTVETLHLIIHDYESRADDAQRDTPLHDGDLANDMAEAIASVVKATWNARTGTIMLQTARVS